MTYCKCGHAEEYHDEFGCTRLYEGFAYGQGGIISKGWCTCKKFIELDTTGSLAS